MYPRLNPRLHRFLLIAMVLPFGGGSGSISPAWGQGTKITEFPAGFVERSAYHDMVFAPNGRTIALVDWEGKVKLCDLTTGKAEVVPNPYKGKQWGTNVAYSGGGQLLAVGYEAHGTVIWDIDGKNERGRIPLQRAAVVDMVFIEGDRTLCALVETTKGNTLVGRWEVPSGAPKGTLELAKGSFAEVLSPGGRHAVLQYGVLEYAVFDLTNGKKVFDLKRSGGWVFSRDGSTLISCEDDRLSIREIPSGKDLKHFGVTPDFGLAYSPRPSLSSDGKLLAVQAYPRSDLAAVISLETGKLLDTVECGPPLSICKAVRLSPDGRMMATRTEGVNAHDQPAAPILKLWKLPASW